MSPKRSRPVRFWRRVLRAARNLLLLFLVYLLLGATLPFAWNHPEVSEAYAASVAGTDFYDATPGPERVALVETNQDALEARIQLITQAQERVILSTFDFHSDESGQDVLALLLDAAERGVQVQVLVDGVTGFLRMTGNPLFQALSAHPNAEIRQYNPPNLLAPWTLNGRLHDKYVIVDETGYLLGGRNTYDYFLGEYPTEHPSQDLEVFVYNTAGDEEQGSMAQLLDYFSSVWNSESCVTYCDDEALRQQGSVQEAAQQLENRFQWLQAAYPDAFTTVDYAAVTEEAGAIHLVSNPINVTVKEPQVLYTMTELMAAAEEEVVLHSPYAVCNQAMYDALERVASSVPSFTLLLNGVANGDNLMASSDYLRNKGAILATGVTLYEYSGPVSDHGKSVTIDGELAIIGSFNWDMRAAYLDTELMLVVSCPALAAELDAYTDGLLAQSRLCLDETEYVTPDGLELPEMSAGKAALLWLLRGLTVPIRYLL